MREDETVQVAAYVLHKWKPLPEPVDGWQFVERRGDEGEEREPEEPYRVRRRIRDKTQKKVLEDEGVLKALRATIEEEEKAVTNDEPEVMDIMVKALEGLKKEEEELRSSAEVEKDEEQILQTKIVSAKEVEMNLEDWKAPMKKELDTIVEEKGAITKLNPASARELLENNPRVQLPAAGPFTSTVPPPPPSTPTAKPPRPCPPRRAAWPRETPRSCRTPSALTLPSWFDCEHPLPG